MEKARTGGLAVVIQTGRWEKVRPDKRRCDHCNARNGTAEHASERCCEFDDDRADVRLKLRELGLVDTSPWGVVVKGGTAFHRGDGTLKKRQTALRVLNAYFRKIDESKRLKRK